MAGQFGFCFKSLKRYTAPILMAKIAQCHRLNCQCLTYQRWIYRYLTYSTVQYSTVQYSTVQYSDYANWQQQLKQHGGFDAHLDYREKQLKGAPQLLELATDHPRKTVQYRQGAIITFALPDELKQQLNSLSIANSATLFMTLLAGFKILLWRYTEQSDLLVGSAIANRGQNSLEALIGFFVDTLVLRTKIGKNDTLVSLLEKIKSTTLGAYEHQQLPFEQLINHLNPTRS
jgi:hypothetical protein